MKARNRILATLIAVLMISVSAITANAQTAAERDPPPAVWKSEGNFKAVQKAWELIANEQYQEAITDFVKLVDKIGDPYEKSQAMFGLAQAYVSLEQYDRALKVYETIIDMDVLDNKNHFESMYQMAQLYYMRERLDDSLRWVNRWMEESGDIKVDAYTLKATIYAQKEQYRPALENVDKAISLADKPREEWYSLKMAMHYELKEFNAVREVLEILVRGWSDKKQYWVQLASINVTLKRDREALAILALAHRQDMLDKESDLMQLFSLYGYLEMPYQAASVMQEGIDKGIIEAGKKEYEQLGNAWYAAQELDNSIAALSKAGELSLDGKLDMQVAHILVAKEDWSKAKVALASAIRKGGLSETNLGKMQELLGLSELSLGNYSAARKAFNEALKYEKSRSAATQWLNHIKELERERERIAAAS